MRPRFAGAEPPYSTRPLWKYEKLVRAYPVDGRFKKTLAFIYRDRKEELQEWPLKQFHAIDLLAFLNALPREPAGEGDYIIYVRGERLLPRIEDRYSRVALIASVRFHSQRWNNFDEHRFRVGAPAKWQSNAAKT